MFDGDSRQAPTWVALKISQVRGVATGSRDTRYPRRSISWVRFLEACFGFCSGVMVASMSDYRHKRYNVSSLLYHIVCPAKYRRVIFDAEIDTVLKDVCLDIAKRYDIAFSLNLSGFLAVTGCEFCNWP
jgi:hypothetical protein